MSVTTVSAHDAGKTCPYCRFPLKSGAVAMRCEGCAAVHHEDCWRDCGGCAVFGCPDAGAGADGGGGPPADDLSSFPPPTHVGPAPRSNARRNVLAGALSVLLAATVAGGVLVAIRSTALSSPPAPPATPARTVQVTTQVITEAIPRRPPRRRRLVTIPNGVYGWKITPTDLRAKGRNEAYIAENTGVMTMSLSAVSTSNQGADGNWTFEQRSSTARHASLNGHYRSVGQVVTFTITGPKGDSQVGDSFSATWRASNDSLVLSDFSSPGWGDVMGLHTWSRVG
jgi:hypothetical protein